MWLHIDPRSGLPIYRQIVEQIRRARAAGSLLSGDRLPSVRELAEKVVVNPNTVAKAYRELEREGVIETRRGIGTFVTEGPLPLSEETRRRILLEIVDRLIAEARNLGVPKHQLKELLEGRVEEWRGPAPGIPPGGAATEGDKDHE